MEKLGVERRLYTAGEHEGITDCRLRQTTTPWMGAADLRAALLSQTRVDPGPVDPSVEAFVNASNLFAWIDAAAARPHVDDARMASLYREVVLKEKPAQSENGFIPLGALARRRRLCSARRRAAP